MAEPSIARAAVLARQATEAVCEGEALTDPADRLTVAVFAAAAILADGTRAGRLDSLVATAGQTLGEAARLYAAAAAAGSPAPIEDGVDAGTEDAREARLAGALTAVFFGLLRVHGFPDPADAVLIATRFAARIAVCCALPDRLDALLGKLPAILDEHARDLAAANAAVTRH